VAAPLTSVRVYFVIVSKSAIVKRFVAILPNIARLARTHVLHRGTVAIRLPIARAAHFRLGRDQERIGKWGRVDNNAVTSRSPVDLGAAVARLECLTPRRSAEKARPRAGYGMASAQTMVLTRIWIRLGHGGRGRVPRPPCDARAVALKRRSTTCTPHPPGWTASRRGERRAHTYTASRHRRIVDHGVQDVCPGTRWTLLEGEESPAFRATHHGPLRDAEVGLDRPPRAG